MLHFEWDPTKNRINKLKHKISFEEAATVFCDPNALILDDPDHSYEENRFLLIGISRNTHICTISHCYRNQDDTIRIISARKATHKETLAYSKYNNQKRTLI